MTDLSKADERACEPLIDAMTSLLDQQTVTISMGALLEMQRAISKRDVALRKALEALECHADLGIKADKAIAAIKGVLEP